MYIKRLKDIREDNDLKQMDIAKMLNIKRSTYSMWEIGDITIPLKKLDEYAKCFHLTMDYIIGLNNIKIKNTEKKKFELKTLGKNLKAFRKKQKLTQEKLAEIIDTTQSSYAYYEYGKTPISVKKLTVLAKKYNLSIDYLCYNKDEH